MAKSPDAFRTISEVADWLGIQAHVLRFWESKFTQVKPIKRAGGRRYYRPGDMQLLGGIKQLLHEDGLTIKGVQKILREEGMSHVAAMSAPLDELTQSQLDDTPTPAEVVTPEPPAPERGVVLSFEAPAEKVVKDALELIDKKQDVSVQEPIDTASAPDDAPPSDPAPVEEQPDVAPAEPAPEAAAEEPSETVAEAPPADPEPEAQTPEAQAPETIAQERADEPEQDTTNEPEPEPEPEAASPEPEPTPEPAVEPAADDAVQDAQNDEPAPAQDSLPAFLRRPLDEQDDAPIASDNTPAPVDAAQDAEPVDTTEPVEAAAVTPEPAAPPPEPPAPKPRVIPAAKITPEADIPAAPAVLAAAYRLKTLDRSKADQITPLLAKLTVLRDSMAARRRGGGDSPTPNP
jgi:DNA-binding transcriptional MerR regulator